MGKNIFATVVCDAFSYPIINYLYDITQIADVEKVYICFWDVELLRDPSFNKSLSPRQSPRDKIEKIVKTIRQFFLYYGIETEVIYYSDARERIAKSEYMHDLLHSVLANISLNSVFEYYSQAKFLGGKKGNLARLLYLSADFVTCIYFDKLFPEFNAKMDGFFAGKRFEPVLEAAKKTLQEKNIQVEVPKHYKATNLPIICYHKDNWININMARREIERQAEEEMTMLNGLTDEDIMWGVKTMSGFMDRAFYYPDSKKIGSGENIGYFLKRASKKQKKEFVVENIERYLGKARRILDSIELPSVQRTVYVRKGKELKGISSVLNPAKMDLVSLCDGKQTVEKIAEHANIAPNSAKSYISQLRKAGVVSKDKMPKRRINEIRISFT